MAVLFALLIIVGIPASCSVMTARIESDVQLAKVRAHVDSMGVTNAR